MQTRKILSIGMPELKRLLPLGVLLGALITFFVFGGHRQLTFDAIAMRYGDLTGWVEDQPLAASLVLVALYATATALSFPAAWLLTVATGLVFGWIWGSALVVVGATIGAIVLFLAARHALKDFFAARAGGIVARFADGFKADAASYMLFLRMVPVFPFYLVNAVPAIVGVPLFTFAWTTFLGIIPGAIAYSFAGEGLRSIISERAEACAANVAPCGTPLTPSELVTPQILVAFVLLAMVSLLPAVLKRFRARPGKND